MALYVLLMGVQGAGKGEQAKFITQTYGIPQVSTGDLFRAMKGRQDDLAKEVKALMDAGKLIPDDLTNRIVEERLNQADAQNGVILDGYPRTTNQADFLTDLLAKKGQAIKSVILFELDLYTAFKRAFGRVSDSNGQGYNIFFVKDELSVSVDKHPEGLFPPRIIATLNTTGETLKRREDDADALAVLKRIDTYVAETAPLIEYYDSKDLLRRLDARQPITTINQAVKDLLG